MKKKKDGRANNGGARAGAGRPRKAKNKKKIPITVYVDPSELKSKKQKKAVKELIINTLEGVKKD